MINLIDRHVSKLAIAAVVGGLSLALSACTPGNVVDGSPATTKQVASNSRVEKRIQTLHDKLQITADQESQFAAVADVIRGNETTIHELAEARHANEGATAVEDLKSYKEIADAHSNGLAKLIPAFENLYSTLSDAQKANADKLFSRYEGHEGHKEHNKEHKKHKHHQKAAASPAAPAASPAPAAPAAPAAQ